MKREFEEAQAEMLRADAVRQLDTTSGRSRDVGARHQATLGASGGC